MRVEGLVREYPLKPAAMTNRLTATEDLFVLAHMGLPEVDLDGWSFDIAGLVARLATLTLDDLAMFPQRSIEAAHQCAGSPLKPTLPTRQVANVRWGGVDLHDLLDTVGVDARATYLWTSGIDHGAYAGVAQAHYQKDMPLSRVAEGDVLIATQLNGAPLTHKHGAPARLVIPGFYGTNNVKWISRLELADRRADSLFTTRFYNDPIPGEQTTKPVWRFGPESLIVAPSSETYIDHGEAVEIWGWAWSHTDVRRVEVSTDGGATWRGAALEPRHQRSWQRYRLTWNPDHPGTYRLQCRATDAEGQTQPLDGARNQVHGIDVVVA